jgi:hypothetical protein
MSMKRILVLLIVLFPSITNAQKIAATFRDAVENKGLSIEKLDETYQSALHDDSTKAAFKGQEKEFYDAYISLLRDLGTHLKENNFKWGKKTRCFNRIYINKEGGIDYFLFNFKPEEVSSEKEAEFRQHLERFIQTYKFPLTNKVNFAQCSPVTYLDQ